MTDANAQSRPWIERYYTLALSPWSIIVCVLAGAAFGNAYPLIAHNFAFIGKIYVDLLKMIVLPFMVAAIVFSLQKLTREGDTSRIMGRVFWVFLVFSFATVAVTAVLTLVMHPGDALSQETRSALGKIVGNDVDSSNTRMYLFAKEAEKERGVTEFLENLIPSNIFASLSNGETLKAMIFALLLGVSIGKVSQQNSASLTQALETIYRACQVLTRWVNFPLPLVLFSMSASQVADFGLEPVKAMAAFVLAVLLAAAVLLFLSVYILRLRSGLSLRTAAASMREVFALGVATNNAASCMPAMIEGLAGILRFDRSRVELLVPLATSLLRTGAMAYFVSATLFVADLYGRQFSVAEIAVLSGVCVLAGFASSGMAGVVTITLVATTTGFFGLPFEAAYVLFVAVDPICAMARTAVTVIGGAAAISVVCDKPAVAREPSMAGADIVPDASRS